MLTNSLTSILSGFNKTVTKLEAFSEKARVAISQKADMVDTLHGEIDSLRKEVTTADQVAANIRLLLEGKQ